MEELKKTCLYEKHIALNAKMSPFGGFDMPIQYTSITNEHNAVRSNVGMFDVSHMGQVIVTGEQAEEFVNYLFTNDICPISNGKTIYGMMLQPNGGVVDDLLVYKLEQNKYLLVINASNIDKDLNWIMLQNKNFKVGIENLSDYFGELAIQGPKSEETIQKLMGIQLTDLEFYSFKEVSYRGEDIIISRTGYTGEDGFELLVINEYAEYLWDTLLEKGKEFNVMPVGLGARDTLRLEAALPLYGNDLSEDTTPIEAGLSWSIPKDKQEFYNGKEVIKQQLENGVEKKLVGLQMNDKFIARHGYEVFYNNEKVGEITSGGISPILNTNIATAYVTNSKNICIGSTVQVMIREKLHDATIVKRPFVEKRNKVKNQK